MTEYFYRSLKHESPVRYAYGTFFWDFRGVPRRLASASVFLLWVLIFLLSWVPSAAGQEEALGEDNVIELSLDELLNVESSSVSKRAEKKSAAAIYVPAKTSSSPLWDRTYSILNVLISLNWSTVL